MFQGDKKWGQSLLHNQEAVLRNLLLPHIPKWMETYHLTLMTLIWNAFILLFCYLARFNIHWLWGVSLMIAAQYVTDLLDGAIGRQRNTGLIKWGFYMDHFLDFFFLCALLIGYAILLPHIHRTALFFVMTIFSGFMVNSFLSFAATNRFQIAYYGIGPTEIRLIFILINTLVIIFGTRPIILAMPYTLALATFGLFVTVYRTQRELWRVDMAAKHGHGAAPEHPPTRHRRTFAAGLTLALIGIWVASLAHGELVTRLAALILFAAAAALFFVSFADFRRARPARRFLVAALWLYLPYYLVALLLIFGLRTWFHLAPSRTTAPPQAAATLDTAPFDATAAFIGTHLSTNPPPAAPGAFWRAYREQETGLHAIEERYSGFMYLDMLAQPQEHADAFTLYFAAYTQRCVLNLKTTAYLHSHPPLRDAIDTLDPAAATALIKSTADDAIWVKLSMGALYYRLHRAQATPGSPLLPLIDANLDFLRKRLPAAVKDTLINETSRLF